MTNHDTIGYYEEMRGLVARQPPQLTPTIWVTREGESIPVVEMTDTHLLNTVRYLRRVTRLELDDAVRSGYSILGTLQGEVAIDSVEDDLRVLEEMDIDERLEGTCPTWSALLAEAERRGLEVR